MHAPQSAALSLPLPRCPVNGRHRWKWPVRATQADGIVFVIDATDVLRLPLAWTELTALVQNVEHGMMTLDFGQTIA